MPRDEDRTTAAIFSARPALWKMRMTSPSKCTARGSGWISRSRS
jgi:hypothetical protein